MWNKQQPEVYAAFSEACPPGYSYLENACNTGHGGLAIIPPLSLAEFASFEHLALRCNPPHPMTILLIYGPLKPNHLRVA